MYDRLLETCEEVDADDSIRVLVLRGAGGKAFVAGTDISQFKVFETAEDGLAYERDGAARSARLERVKKPVIAQIQGYAVGGGFNLTACCDLRVATPDAKFGAPIARTLGNCLSMSFLRDKDWAVALCKAYNTMLHEEFVKVSPRLKAVALLPVQEPAACAPELRRAVKELGLSGGMLPADGTHLLGDGAYDPVYAEAERLGVPLGIHASGSHLGGAGVDMGAGWR